MPLRVFLFVSGAHFGDGSESCFDGALYESAINRPRSEGDGALAELYFTPRGPDATNRNSQSVSWLVRVVLILSK
jgi:hypothetical protein